MYLYVNKYNIQTYYNFTNMYASNEKVKVAIMLMVLSFLYTLNFHFCRVCMLPWVYMGKHGFILGAPVSSNSPKTVNKLAELDKKCPRPWSI